MTWFKWHSVGYGEEDFQMCGLVDEHFLLKSVGQGLETAESCDWRSLGCYQTRLAEYGFVGLILYGLHKEVTFSVKATLYKLLGY